jgi:hypothetical protein
VRLYLGQDASLETRFDTADATARAGALVSLQGRFGISLSHWEDVERMRTVGDLRHLVERKFADRLSACTADDVTPTGFH